MKTIGREISEPLSRISDLTFLTGSIPDNLKIAVLTHIFRANENSEFKNYRPYLFTVLIIICEMKEIK